MKTDPPFSKNRTSSYLLVFVFLILLVLAYHRTTSMGKDIIGNYDGLWYFVYLPSVVVHHNLNFEGYYQVLQSAWLWQNTSGRMVSPMPIGAAILWLPFYVIAHLYVIGANLIGYPIPMNGISMPYIIAVVFGTWIYGFLGVYLCYKICCDYYSPSIALVSVLGVFLGSFMVFYQMYDPFYAHINSFFAVILFIYYWNRTRTQRNQRQWLILGLFAGLMFLVRWQNIVFAVVLIMEAGLRYEKALHKHQWVEVKQTGISHLFFMLAFIITLIPQMIVWKIMYGVYGLTPHDLTVLRGGNTYLLWRYPAISEVLFSSRHGLFSWSPITLFGILGLPFFYKKDKYLAVYLFGTFVIMVYVNSIVADWWGGGGFGMRRFDGFILLFTLGLAALITLIQRYPLLIIIVLLYVFIDWNFILIRQYDNRRISTGGAISWESILQKQLDKKTSNIGYPFSFPANYLFSQKYHVSPEKYDIVAGKYLDYLDNSLNGIIEFGKIDPDFLIKGWSFPEKEEEKMVCWGDATVSALFVTLRYPDNYLVTMHVQPFSYPHAPPQSITVIVNNQETNHIILDNQWKEYSLSIPQKFWKQGINVMQFRYSYAVAPNLVLKNNPDPRTLAVCWDYIKFQRK